MTYSQMISQAPVVLVEFFATWCPHCQKMMPVVDQVRQKLGPHTPVIQLDSDQNGETARANGVDGVPTFIIYQNGHEMWRQSGEIEGAELLAKVRSFE